MIPSKKRVVGHCAWQEPLKGRSCNYIIWQFCSGRVFVGHYLGKVPCTACAWERLVELGWVEESPWHHCEELPGVPEQGI